MGFNSGLKGLTAIQDQVKVTRNYKKYILEQPNIDELCRRCGIESETIQHITAVCEQLAPTEYLKRHDGLAKIIHQKLAEAAELIEEKSPYYKYTPVSVPRTGELQFRVVLEPQHTDGQNNTL
jgi:hypothetical protein